MAAIPSGAWVVVGDGEKALFLRNAGDEMFPNLSVISAAHHDNPPNRDQAADGPGARAAAATGTPASPMSDTDFHRMEKDRFAHEIADRLYKAAHRGEYDALIIVAPPHVLGELRKALHKEVQSRLLFDLAKELTNQPVGEIEAALAAA